MAETRGGAPKDYETLMRMVHERHPAMSPTNQKISVFLTQSPNDVAMKSVNAVAGLCGVHASSLVRYAQAFGFQGFTELQRLYQKRLITAAPGFEARVEALSGELSSREDHSEAGFLRDLVVRDVASLQGLLETIDAASLAKASALMAGAESIYILGQLRAAPVAEFMRYILTMLGKQVVLLDPGGGLATHMARTMKPSSVLIVISFRFYANEVVSIAEATGATETPVIAITDSSLSPVAKPADVFFAAPESGYTFSRSLAAPMCIAQALTVAVAARLQKNNAPHIPTVTDP